jgi:hypothetical protein
MEWLSDCFCCIVCTILIRQLRGLNDLITGRGLGAAGKHMI